MALLTISIGTYTAGEETGAGTISGANRTSANIVLFLRSPQDGSLAYAGCLEGIDDPVCLLARKHSGGFS
jgi:hypothetical protein